MKSNLAAEISSDWFKLTWKNTDLFDALVNADEEVKKKVRAVMEYKAPQVEAHMKVNAPWTDQTGNARQGLAAQAFEEGDNQGIILYHQVPYGIWLEVRHSGRYAIITPTIESMGPEVMQSLENILGEIRFS